MFRDSSTATELSLWEILYTLRLQYTRSLPDRRFLLHKLNKTRFNVCVDEMAPFESFAAVFKGCSTFEGDGTRGSLPRRRDG